MRCEGGWELSWNREEGARSEQRGLLAPGLKVGKGTDPERKGSWGGVWPPWGGAVGSGPGGAAQEGTRRGLARERGNLAEGDLEDLVMDNEEGAPGS